jgi:hypothetical protein
MTVSICTEEVSRGLFNEEFNDFIDVASSSSQRIAIKDPVSAQHAAPQYFSDLAGEGARREWLLKKLQLGIRQFLNRCGAASVTRYEQHCKRQSNYMTDRVCERGG